MALSAQLKGFVTLVSSPVIKSGALALITGLTTVFAYHMIYVKPSFDGIDAAQQRLVTVNITGLVRLKAADLALRKEDNLDDQAATKVAELQTYNDRIQQAIEAFNGANGGNIVVLPQEAVASPVEDITPIIKEIIDSQNPVK
ncbi:hypothetical protein SJS42_20690 [Aeromonas caviae]|uniref:hypothetical protein n=1 Tax=Aeromonas caviae TaxID=648 RepID=UPI0029D47986|nr:hypothetical protein [Aeromonas caviae]MDX7801051.1 hypothetical protein [Aeromonas caviae]